MSQEAFVEALGQCLKIHLPLPTKPGINIHLPMADLHQKMVGVVQDESG